MIRFALLLALTLAACNGCNHTLPPVDPPAPVLATCATACDNARTHNFSFARPTKAGASCEQVCQNAQDSGDTWDLHCRTIAQTQDEADSCEH